MADSTLAVDFDTIQREVGRELGFPLVPSSWSSDQETIAQRVIESGYRMFLRAHSWRFLKPAATLTVRAPGTGTASVLSIKQAGRTEMVADVVAFQDFLVGDSIVVVGITATISDVQNGTLTLDSAVTSATKGTSFTITKTGIVQDGDLTFGPTLNQTQILFTDLPVVVSDPKLRDFFKEAIGTRIAGTVTFLETGNVYSLIGTNFGRMFVAGDITAIESPTSSLTVTQTGVLQSSEVVSNAISTLTATGDVFASTLTSGDTLTFAASSNLFTVSDRVSNAKVNLIGIATGESSTDTFLLSRLDEAPASGKNYDLPEDFGRMDGRFTFQNNNRGLPPIEIVAEGQIRSLRQRRSTLQSGAPRFVAIRPKLTNETSASQKQEAIFFPEPNAVYDLDYTYRRIPLGLNVAQRFPWGGVEHGETVIAACLAQAERRENDVRGIRWEEWQEALRDSIRLENSFAPNFLGENTDRSDDLSSVVGFRGRHGTGMNLVTHNNRSG